MTELPGGQHSTQLASDSIVCSTCPPIARLWYVPEALEDKPLLLSLTPHHILSPQPSEPIYLKLGS